MADSKKETVVCNGCGQEIERSAQEGQTLQPSDTFVCDQCAADHNHTSGAIKDELEANKSLRAGLEKSDTPAASAQSSANDADEK